MTDEAIQRGCSSTIQKTTACMMARTETSKLIPSLDEQQCFMRVSMDYADRGHVLQTLIHHLVSALDVEEGLLRIDHQGVAYAAFVEHPKNLLLLPSELQQIQKVDLENL